MTGQKLPTNRETQLLAERIRLLYGNPYVGYVVAAVLLSGAAATALLQWPVAAHERVLTWLALIAACELTRVVLHVAYHLARPPASRARRWGWPKAAHALFVGLSWGSGIMLMYNPAQPQTLVFPVVGIALLAAAGSVLNSVYPPSLFALPLGIIPPGFLYLLWLGGDYERVFAVILGAVFVVAAVGGTIAAQIIRTAILLRFDLADAVERERELRAQAQLLREQAEGAKARQDRFFSTASHDLRQPVHALGLYMSLLRKNPPERERKELIENVGHCADSLDRLFNAILGVSEAARAQGQVKAAAIALGGIIEQVAVQLAPEAARKGLALRTAPTSLWVNADEPALARILGNLVANAIRYTERGTVLVGVRRGNPRHCALVVADTGIGIVAGETEKIFDDFYQIDNPGRDRSRGFGLGLAIVRRWCETFGYAIAVRSTPGRGSLFAVTLPRAEPAAAIVASPAVEDSAAGVHVLFVEDDPLVRDAMQRMLRTWNMPMQACANGAQAIAILSREPGKRWHVLLDYRLADGENGLQIADRLRATFNPPPRISMMTGDTDPDVHEAAAASGIVILSKPVKPIRLRAVLTAQNLL